MTDFEPGQRAYEAYWAANPGGPIGITWALLSEAVKPMWGAVEAALAPAPTDWPEREVIKEDIGTALWALLGEYNLPGHVWEQAAEAIDDILALLSPRPGDREGWKLVPVEAAYCQQMAAKMAYDDCVLHNERDVIKVFSKIYAAMLSASPAPPEEGRVG